MTVSLESSLLTWKHKRLSPNSFVDEIGICACGRCGKVRDYVSSFEACVLSLCLELEFELELLEVQPWRVETGGPHLIVELEKRYCGSGSVCIGWAVSLQILSDRMGACAIAAHIHEGGGFPGDGVHMYCTMYVRLVHCCPASHQDFSWAERHELSLSDRQELSSS